MSVGDDVWRASPANPATSDAGWAWAAGIFEGEGCVFLMKHPRSAPRPSVTINMTDRDVLERFCSTVGVGRVRAIKRGKWMKPHYKDQFAWTITRYPDVLMLFEKFRPWLGERRLARFEQCLAVRPRHPNAKRSERCREGHPLEGPGSDVRVVTKFGKLQRVCRTCTNANARARRASTRELDS